MCAISFGDFTGSAKVLCRVNVVKSESRSLSLIVRPCSDLFYRSWATS